MLAYPLRGFSIAVKSTMPMHLKVNCWASMDDYQGFVTPSRYLNQEAKNEESKDAEAEYCEMDGAFTTPMGSHKCPQAKKGQAALHASGFKDFLLKLGRLSRGCSVFGRLMPVFSWHDIMVFRIKPALIYPEACKRVALRVSFCPGFW